MRKLSPSRISFLFGKKTVWISSPIQFSHSATNGLEPEVAEAIHSQYERPISALLDVWPEVHNREGSMTHFIQQSTNRNAGHNAFPERMLKSSLHKMK